MRASKDDLTPSIDLPEGTAWETEFGAMVIEINDINSPIDFAPMLKGLPNDSCPCPHWGYVIAGQMRVSYDDHDEVYRTGDVFYMPPGHVPRIDGTVEYVTFSPKEDWAATSAAIARNMGAAH